MRYLIPLILLLTSCGDCPDDEPLIETCTVCDIYQLGDGRQIVQEYTCAPVVNGECYIYGLAFECVAVCPESVTE